MSDAGFCHYCRRAKCVCNRPASDPGLLELLKECRGFLEHWLMWKEAKDLVVRLDAKIVELEREGRNG